MSYDLFYAVPAGRSGPSWDDLEAWSRAQPHLSAIQDDAGRRLHYENPDTGVYATFWAGPQPDEIEVGAGHTFAGLHFNLNTCRASFFALEAMPVAQAAAEAFGLVGLDPQAGELGPVVADTLIERWRRGNASAISAHAAIGGDPRPSMPEADAVAYWQYCRRFVEYKARWDSGGDALDGFMVPQLVVLADRDHRALRAAFLPRPTTYLAPPCDLFILRRGQGTVMVSAQTIFEALDDVFEPADAVIDCEPGEDELRFATEVSLFEPGAMDRWDEVHAHAPAEIDATTLTRLRSDGFVDES